MNWGAYETQRQREREREREGSEGKREIQTNRDVIDRQTERDGEGPEREGVRQRD